MEKTGQVKMADIASAQHFVECSICQRNAEFFCKTCKKDLCQQCKEAHQKEKLETTHDIVLFQEKFGSVILEETCREHKGQKYCLCCQQCLLPVCAECTKDAQHKKHSFVNLENVYHSHREKHEPRILKIRKEILPSCQSIQQDVQDDLSLRKKETAEILSIMKTRAAKIKILIDDVVEDYSKILADICKTQKSELQEQNREITDRITHLNTVLDGYECTRNKPAAFLFYLKEHPSSHADLMPHLLEMPYPVLTKENFTRDDVVKMLGHVESPKAETPRKVKDIAQQTYQIPPLVISDTVMKIKSFRVTGIKDCYQISAAPNGQFWLRDEDLRLTDLTGATIHKVSDVLADWAIQSVTKEGELIYLDSKSNICKLSLDNKKRKSLVQVKDPWKPSCIFCSSYNGDILVGMIRYEQAKVTESDVVEAKVVRLSDSGKEIQTITHDVTGQSLYSYPRYITENHNGDVVVSDHTKNAVVAVDHRKKPRFCYTGTSSNSEFWPRGISVDALMNIIICDYNTDTVQLIDKNGHFLRMLLTEKDKLDEPSCLTCVGEDQFLWVGCRGSRRISAFSYLHKPV